MHVVDKTCYCPKLTVDNWKVKVVEDLFTGDKVIVDEYDGDHTMEAQDFHIGGHCVWTIPLRGSPHPEKFPSIEWNFNKFRSMV